MTELVWVRSDSGALVTPSGNRSGAIVIFSFPIITCLAGINRCSCAGCNGRFSAEVYGPSFATQVFDTEEEAKDWVADVLANATMREALE